MLGIGHCNVPHILQLEKFSGSLDCRGCLINGKFINAKRGARQPDANLGRQMLGEKVRLVLCNNKSAFKGMY